MRDDSDVTEDSDTRASSKQSDSDVTEDTRPVIEGTRPVACQCNERPGPGSRSLPLAP